MTALKKTYLFFLKYSPIILFVVLFLVFTLFSRSFLSFKNLENIIFSATYVGVLAIGMTFVLLTGGIDLSVGANMFLSASVAGVLLRDFNVPLWLALLAAFAIGIAYGAFNAFCIVKLKVLPFLITIGTLQIGRGLTKKLTNSAAVPLNDTITSISSARIFGIPLLIIIFLIIALLAHIVLNYTQFGRQVYAVGNDAEAAKKAGIKTERVIFKVYAICGLLASVAGVIAVAQAGIVNAGFGKGDEFDAISSAVIGGTSLFGGVGSVLPGTFIGTILIQTINTGLVYLQNFSILKTVINSYVVDIITAFIIFLAVFIDCLRNNWLKKLERNR